MLAVMLPVMQADAVRVFVWKTSMESEAKGQRAADKAEKVN
jgi:hypothetical protein